MGADISQESRNTLEINHLVSVAFDNVNSNTAQWFCNQYAAGLYIADLYIKCLKFHWKQVRICCKSYNLQIIPHWFPLSLVSRWSVGQTNVSNCALEPVCCAVRWSVLLDKPVYCAVRWIVLLDKPECSVLWFVLKCIVGQTDPTAAPAWAAVGTNIKPHSCRNAIWLLGHFSTFQDGSQEYVIDVCRFLQQCGIWSLIRHAKGSFYCNKYWKLRLNCKNLHVWTFLPLVRITLFDQRPAHLHHSEAEEGQISSLDNFDLFANL